MPSTASRDSEGSCDPDAGNAVAEYVMVRTRAIITDAVGAGYAQNITVSRTGVGELPAIEVHVVAPLPVVATLGPADALEVSGHAVDMDA